LARKGRAPGPLKLLPVPLDLRLCGNESGNPFGYILSLVVSRGKDGYLRRLDEFAMRARHIAVSRHEQPFPLVTKFDDSRVFDALL
jgi:hypothetical protein